MTTVTLIVILIVSHYLVVAGFLFSLTDLYLPLYYRFTPMSVVLLAVLLWPIYLLVYAAHVLLIVGYQLRAKYGK